MYEKAKRAADVIRAACGEAEIGLILGSGLADTVQLSDARTIAYTDIPGFPVSTVLGHRSEWVCGTLNGKRVCMMRGRFHPYEGYTAREIALPVWTMKLLGVQVLIVTNAAGGINTDYAPGDLMRITDHINYAGFNPLIGENPEELGPRFFDMSRAYDRELGAIARDCAGARGIRLHEGVYIAFKGPSFETPAEIRMAGRMGADAVGMSTIPEVIAARHCGIRVLGISCITNMAAGILDQPLSHEEVIETGNRVRDDFAALVSDIVGRI